MEDVRAGSDHRGVGRLVVITGLPGSGKTHLATELAMTMPAVRLCPDDWMMSSGIDLWDAAARDRIEQFQLSLALELLRGGANVIIEWGVWSREERDALRHAARSIGASVELRCLFASTDELWRRIVARDLEGRWGSRAITREELEQWSEVYEEPTNEEVASYDAPAGGRMAVMGDAADPNPLPPFHLAFPCREVAEAVEFYRGLGCSIGRVNDHAGIIDFFGHQIVAHRAAAIDPQQGIYPRHFGLMVDLVTLDRIEADLRRLAPDRTVRAHRFPGERIEHHSLQSRDPSGNVLEFKHYVDERSAYEPADERTPARIGDLPA
jgi:extradiol dioxygenase family protein/predicted kinase